MNLTRMVSRSTAAFLLSAERLAAISRRLYFWTFTWPEELDLPGYRTSWNRFTVALSRQTAEDFAALRVWEEHPGGHGLHVHMLGNERLDVNMVRPIARRTGIGRIHVRRARGGDADYITKYMTKGRRVKGVKVWAALGNWRHVKVGDVVFESRESEFLRNLYQSPGVQRLPPNRRWLETRRLFALLWPKLWETEDSP